MGVLAPTLILKPSGVCVSNVYMGFGHQTISISKIFQNYDQNSPAATYIDEKYHVYGYLFVKQNQEDLDSPLTYFIESFVMDIPSNPYELLYTELKKIVPSTVDC